MNVFEKVVSIYLFEYDLKKKKIEFTSFRFLKFLFCFQFLYVCAVCNILIRILKKKAVIVIRIIKMIKKICPP